MPWLANVVSSAAQLAILFLVRFTFLATTRLVIRIRRRRRVSGDHAKPASSPKSNSLFDSATPKSGGFVDGLFLTDGLDKTRTRCAFALAVASAAVCCTIVVLDVGLVVLGSPRVRNSVTTNRPILLDLAAEGGRPGDVHRPTDSCVQRLRDPHASSTISARTNVVCASLDGGMGTSQGRSKRVRLEATVKRLYSAVEALTYNSTGSARTGRLTLFVASNQGDATAGRDMDATFVYLRGETSVLSPPAVGDLARQDVLEYVLLPGLANTEAWDGARGVMLAVMKTWASSLAREEFGGASCRAARNTFPTGRNETADFIDHFIVSCPGGVSLQDGVAALQEALFSHLTLKETTLEDPGGNIATAVFAKEVERGIPPVGSAVLIAVAVIAFCADFVAESKYVSAVRFAAHRLPGGRLSRLLYSTETIPIGANGRPEAQQ
jgi:hypothetical protein